MQPFKLSNFLHVPDDYISYDDLKRQLTFFDPSASYQGEENPYFSLLYGADEKGQYLTPRAIFPNVPRDDTAVQDVWENTLLPPNTFSYPKLWAEQKKALRALISDNPNHAKSLVSGCGTGKTVMSIAYMAWCHCRTIVIVDTEPLRDQWIQELIAHAKLKLDQIGIVQGSKCEIGGRYAVSIAMVQTLRSRNYGNDFWNHFGLAIYEEGSVFGARTYSTLVPQSLGKRLLITATFNRTDNRNKVYECHIGKPCYVNIATPHVPEIWIYETGMSFMVTKSGKEKKDFDKWGRYHRSNVKSRIADNVTRNKALIPLIDAAYKAGREILFISERITQLTFLYEHFKRRGYDCSIALGKQHKGPSADEVKQHRLIFAIDRLFYKGFNKKSLDVLFEGVFVTSANQIQQRIGRILRESDDEDKHPVVILFEDADQIFKNLTRKTISAIQRIWSDDEIEVFRKSLT